MKTSNKIMTGLLLLIFAVPLFLAMTLKSKITKGEYVVKYYNEEHRPQKHTGNIESFTVVKVVAPNPEALECHLKLSSQLDYSYNTYRKEDSVAVYNLNDTLYVVYVQNKTAADGGPNRFRNNLEVNLNVPAFNNLVVDGATVIINSMPPSSTPLSVNLNNNGVVKDGTMVNNKDHVFNDAKPNSSINSVAKANQAVLPQASDNNNTVLDVKNAVLSDLSGIDFKEILINRLLYRI